MFISILYIILAILGLSFLIFIHELGHYWMARRTGMKVETFSVGIGRPIWFWMRGDVKWQIGWLPFGGYVKIKGQEIEKGVDPYAIPDGFFGKSPWARIKVAAAGPLINILFAFVAFAALWTLGGRDKSFSEFTHKIGWVDPKSELYNLGVRPGDEITAFNGTPYEGAKDILFAPTVSGDEVGVQGYKINYSTGEKTPFNHTVKTYPYPLAKDKGIKTSGILNTANYLIYDKLPKNRENPLPEGSPLKDSGIQYGDRVVWIDGDMIFSEAEMSHLLNDSRALLTVKREGKTLLRRVPRIQVQELKLEPTRKEELVDWQFEAQLKGVKFPKLYYIPYNLDNDAVVESDIKFIDKEKQNEQEDSHAFSTIEEPLKAGDKIIAVDGVPISRSYELLARIQNHQVNIIVERNPKELRKVLWTQADGEFDGEIEWQNLEKIASTIGTSSELRHAGDLHLLRPVTPKIRADFILSPERQAWEAAEQLEIKKKIESIDDPEQRAQAYNQLEKKSRLLLLGLPYQDRKVVYNPGPIRLFDNVFSEIWTTLKALVSRTVSYEGLSGPIGIVRVVQETSMVSLLESLFWLGAISLNLGILNLLPIPVLDGGHIVLTLIEVCSGRKLHPKTLEKIIIPFAILLIGLFILLTYQDLTRIFR